MWVITRWYICWCLTHPQKRDEKNTWRQTGEASWIAASQPFCSSLGLSRWTPFCVWGSKPRALHLAEESPAKGKNLFWQCPEEIYSKGWYRYMIQCDTTMIYVLTTSFMQSAVSIGVLAFRSLQFHDDHGHHSRSPRKLNLPHPWKRSRCHWCRPLRAVTVSPDGYMACVHILFSLVLQYNCYMMFWRHMT